MPKKTRRQKLRASRRPVTVPQTTVQAETVVRPTSQETVPVVQRPATPAAPYRISPAAPTYDYHYVYSDLKRIGILAASFFIILFALAFILH